jgi:hypothetical protein
MFCKGETVVPVPSEATVEVDTTCFLLPQDAKSSKQSKTPQTPLAGEKERKWRILYFISLNYLALNCLLIPHEGG